MAPDNVILQQSRGLDEPAPTATRVLTKQLHLAVEAAPCSCYPGWIPLGKNTLIVSALHLLLVWHWQMNLHR